MNDWYHKAAFSSSKRNDINHKECFEILHEAGLVEAQQAPLECLAPLRAYAVSLKMPSGTLEQRPRRLADPRFERLREIAGERSMDANIVASDMKPARLLVADMDSTVIRGESLDEMSRIAGIGDKVVPITERSMRGEIDFESALRQRVRLLEGKPAGLVDEAVAAIRLTAGADLLVGTMRRRAGARCMLVSGGFTRICEQVADRLGFSGFHANELEIESGRITGEVSGEIVDREAKRRWLLHYRELDGLGIDETMAVGDGANDLDMLDAAGTGVAFNAKPVVKEQAHFQLNHTDLTGLLFLQGYREQDFSRA